MDTVVDGNLPDDWKPASIFSKLISHKPSDSSSDDLYSHFRMNLVSDVVQTEASQFVDLGILAINTLNESSVFGTPVARIKRTEYVSHWSVTDHVIGDSTAVRMIASKSDHDYSYKTDFEIWRENQEFERQNITMSLPHFESTTIGKNAKNVTTSHLDLNPIGEKMLYPTPLT